MIRALGLLLLMLPFTVLAQGVKKKHFSYLDVFDLQYVSDPRISPDGKWIVYRRMGFDIMKDRSKGALWMIDSEGKDHFKLSSREVSESNARWSPDGSRIAFTSSTDEGAEIYMYWVESGKVARLTQLPFSPSGLCWSPDGSALAFAMHVSSKAPLSAKLPPKPKGAKWAKAPRVTDRLYHEADGRGYLAPGFSHIFTIPSQGGAARQLSSGDFNHQGDMAWSADGRQLYVVANRNENWEYEFRNSEIYALNVESGAIKALTQRQGPDYAPRASPDGKYIAYLSYGDRKQAYQTRKLHLMKADGSEQKSISDVLDRSISNVHWDARSQGLYFSYDDKGNSKIAYITLSGAVTKIADDRGGTSIGRPYASGSFSVSAKGAIAYTYSRPEHPAELRVVSGNMRKPKKKQITDLNGALLDYRTLGEVEELWYTSSVDGRDLQGWLVYPPEYDTSKKYPFLIENHGGPILNYGDRFSAEIQLYASAGYIVFYPNPRGSTGYGEEFANLLHQNYPGEDYNDIMDGVDVCIDKGLAHEDQLFVTGGSAGGIMSAWIIGKNSRFEAAVVAKPVMNWISKTLVADNYFWYANSRYPGQPWENFDTYWKFSPLSLVGNISTPTMVMVGMDDLRTPPSEAKQLYHALKLRKIETVLVEIPGAGHGIAARPSNLITKVANTIAWLDRYRTDLKKKE